MLSCVEGILLVVLLYVAYLVYSKVGFSDKNMLGMIICLNLSIICKFRIQIILIGEIVFEISNAK